MADGKEQNMDGSEPNGTKEDLVSSVSTVISGLAALFLEENIRKGEEIFIPSLKIRIPSQSNGFDDSKDDTHENGT